MFLPKLEKFIGPLVVGFADLQPATNYLHSLV